MANTKSARSLRIRGTKPTETAAVATTRASKKSPSKGIPAPHHPPVPSSVDSSDARSSAQNLSPGSRVLNASEVLKKPELLDRMSQKTGLPKSRLRPAMEAILEILGEAIAEGREVQLPPLGKIKPLRSKLQGTARISHVKIRQVSVQQGKGQPGEERDA